MAAEHEKPGGDQLLTPPDRTGEPSSGDNARTFCPDIVPALRLLSKMINEGSKLRPLGSKQGFPVKGGTQYLVGSAHALSMAIRCGFGQMTSWVGSVTRSSVRSSARCTDPAAIGHRAQVGTLLLEDHGQVVHRCHISLG